MVLTTTESRELQFYTIGRMIIRTHRCNGQKMYSTRIGDGSQSNFAVGNSQCHEPPMTGNCIFDGLYMFNHVYTTYKNCDFPGGWFMTLFYRPYIPLHSIQTAFSLVNRPCFLSHPSSPMRRAPPGPGRWGPPGWRTPTSLLSMD